MEMTTADYARVTADPRSRQLRQAANDAQVRLTLFCLMDGLNKAGVPTSQMMFDDGPFPEDAVTRSGKKLVGAVDAGINWQLTPPSGRRQHTLKMMRKRDSLGFAVWAALPLNENGTQAKIVVGDDGVARIVCDAKHPRPLQGPWDAASTKFSEIPLIDEAWLARAAEHGAARDAVAKEVARTRDEKIAREREQRLTDNAGVAAAASQAAAAAIAPFLEKLGRLLDPAVASTAKGGK